jgi:enamine deaminase RidA (YjgF/YER057c/UK114 family)
MDGAMTETDWPLGSQETGDGPDRSPHKLLNPDALAPPVGFSHAVVAAPGRLVFVGGQTAHGADDVLPSGGMVEQFDAACANVATALAAAGARPQHLVSVQIFVTDAKTYRDALKEIGAAWRKHLGKHYPAMALFEIKGLFDPKALVELMAVAVVPDAES